MVRVHRNALQLWRWVLLAAVMLGSLLVSVGCDQPEEFTPAPATIIRAVDTPTLAPASNQGGDTAPTAVQASPASPTEAAPEAVSEYPSPEPVEYVTPVPGVYPEGVTPGVAEPKVSPTPVVYPTD